jgi:hypothetical protein
MRWGIYFCILIAIVFLSILIFKDLEIEDMLLFIFAT